jgi:hypothetical protein
MWSEVVVLLLAIAAFLFLGPLCARRLRVANEVATHPQLHCAASSVLIG